ncbi:MAG TPA: asparagine synthase (glutamine-hydrolyzing) [Anaerolineae bacterium]|nr:asparagine synthase (glutamine-hydrolyzing) [Anaerolineae bacterium]
MCGISGIYALNGEPIKPEALEAQIETLVHRGPNQGATYVSPGRVCGLGIRRLSIIDVAGGQQPLRNETGSVQLVYNGETYNHLELRAELEALGQRPLTHSDGEVIVHGYEVWGPEGMLQRLRGMAAFALWDERQQQLLLGRDRFGIKPLYYAEQAGRLYFASEIKAILADPAFPRRVNLTALDAMLRLGFVPGPATMFEGIYKLPPAHYLIARNGTSSIKPYWQLTYEPLGSPSEVEAAEQFLALLKEAVQLRLMSEVPLGALLSGGLDSGTLTALLVAAQNGGHFVDARTNTLSLRNNNQPSGSALQSSNPSTPLRARPSTPLRARPSTSLRANPPTLYSSSLKTISLGFDQPGYDESDLALALARRFKTDHRPVMMTAADFDDYPVVMQHLEEPQCSATALPLYKLYQACRQAGLTVVLTGEGADELLGGYHWHRGDALVRPLLALPRSLRRAIAASPLPMSVAARRVLRRGAREIPSRYQDWLAVGEADQTRRLLSPEGRGQVTGRENRLLHAWGESLLNGSTGPLHQMLWLQSRTRLVDFINFEVDKMSMAHSIEARVPFLDHKLWAYCAGLPAHYKLKGRTEKYLLRQAVKDLLPESTRRRSKQGLAAPYAQWLRANRLPDWAEESLSEVNLRRAGLFDPAAVAALRSAHQAGQPHLSPLLMGVLSTQVWLKEFRI